MHAFSTHPFTICSLPTTTSAKESELTFYVRQQGGFTNRLHKYALANPGASTPVWVDGPYGGANLQAFDASDRVVLIAGGSGAGWCLPFVELFARQSAALRDEDSSDGESSAKRAPGVVYRMRKGQLVKLEGGMFEYEQIAERAAIRLQKAGQVG